MGVAFVCLVCFFCEEGFGLGFELLYSHFVVIDFIEFCAVDFDLCQLGVFYDFEFFDLCLLVLWLAALPYFVVVV